MLESPLQWMREFIAPPSGRLVLQQEDHPGYTVHKEIGNTWQQIDNKLGTRLRIMVKQGLNSPPELEAQEWDGECILKRSVIGKLNPQLDEVTLAPVSAFDWAAKDGLPGGR